jgi:hypothetical protein
MSYEFTESENETFRGLVAGMKRSGMMVAIASMIFLAYQIVDYFGLNLALKADSSKMVNHLDFGLWCVLATIGVLVAVLLVKATSAFTAVIETQGDDVAHLMGGLVRLRAILKLVFIAATVGSAMLAVSFTLLLIH